MENYGRGLGAARRIRVYRSVDRELPLDEWKLVADSPVVADGFQDDLSNEPKVMHYYFARYVFADGTEGSPSEITSAMPVEDAKDAPIKQRYNLN